MILLTHKGTRLVAACAKGGTLATDHGLQRHAGGVPIRRNTTIPECVLFVTNMSENSIDIHFFSGRGSFHAEGTEDCIRPRADVSSARDDWDAVMTAASTCLRATKARQAARGPSKRACVVLTWRFFLHLTRSCHVDGMEDASPAHGVRGDFSDLHMFAGLEGTDGPSKCACFFGALTSWSAMGLLCFFFVCH